MTPFTKIRRKSRRPEAAKRWMDDNNIQDVESENILDVRSESDHAVIKIDGSIGQSGWDDAGITAKEFDEALSTIPRGQKILMLVNSEGGNVKEGLGIYDSIEARKDDITARISGYALSIASIFPLAAGKVISPDHAIWMIHEAWMVAAGNKRDFLTNSKMLGTHDDVMAGLYEKKSKTPAAVWAKRMESETWATGKEAIALGLADEGDSEDVEAKSTRRSICAQYLSLCKNIPAHIFNALSAAPLQGAVKPKQPQENTMNKKLIVALLKKHGIEANETETEDQLNVKLDSIPSRETTTTTTSPTASIVTREEFEKVQASLAKANEKRIEDKVLTYVEAGKITNDEAPIFVKAAITDEPGTLAILDKKEAVMIGGNPIGYGSIEYVESPKEPGTPQGITGLRGPQSEMLVNIRKEHRTPKARHAAMKEVYDAAMHQAIIKDRKNNREVFAGNTYSATLVTSFLMDGSLTDLTNVWAPLAAFSRDSSVDPYKPLATGVLKHVTVAETVQTDATNFEPSDGSTVAPISVTMHQYTQTARVGNIDLNSGLRLDDLRIKNAASFADKVIQVATAPIVAGTFTATPVISAAAAFSFSDAAQLQGQLKKSPIKNLILDGAYLARLANVPTFFQVAGLVGGSTNAWSGFGWNLIAGNSNWTGAGANIVGFACNPQAIVGVTGLPLTPPNIPGGILQMTSAVVPGLDIAIAMFQWFNPASRTMFISWDIVAGFAAGDTTAGVIVASGTPG